MYGFSLGWFGLGACGRALEQLHQITYSGDDRLECLGRPRQESIRNTHQGGGGGGGGCTQQTLQEMISFLRE